MVRLLEQLDAFKKIPTLKDTSQHFLKAVDDILNNCYLFKFFLIL